jgi:hypothetical protein
MCRRAGLLEASCRTTVRGGGTLVSSWYLSRRHHFNFPLEGVDRLFEEIAHYISWVACKLNDDWGEELLLIGRKPEQHA